MSCLESIAVYDLIKNFLAIRESSEERTNDKKRILRSIVVDLIDEYLAEPWDGDQLVAK